MHNNLEQLLDQVQEQGYLIDLWSRPGAVKINIRIRHENKGRWFGIGGGKFKDKKTSEVLKHFLTCKPSLFKEGLKMSEPNDKVTIKVVRDSRGKNVLTDNQDQFLRKLAALCAEHEVIAYVPGFGSSGLEFRAHDDSCHEATFFKLDSVRFHDDVSDDYILTGNDCSNQRNEIEYYATRQCCPEMNTGTTVVDPNLGLGYTVCKSCKNKRDWR